MYHKDSFPNMRVLAELALTSVVQTAGCERGFSTQNKILTKSRSRLTVENQNQLMMIKIRKGTIDLDRALSHWKLKARRLYELK